MAKPPEKTTPGQIYKAAALVAGAETPKMRCANCTCRFEDIAASHNADKALVRIKRDLETTLPETSPVPSETLPA